MSVRPQIVEQREDEAVFGRDDYSSAGESSQNCSSAPLPPRSPLVDQYSLANLSYMCAAERKQRHLSRFLNYTGYIVYFGLARLMLTCAAFSQHCGGQCNYRTLRKGQQLVHDACSGDGGKM